MNKTTLGTTTDVSTKHEQDNTEEDYIDDFDLSLSEIEVNSLPSPLFDLDDEAREELANFDIMLQSTAAPPSPFHHHPHQRGAGMQGYVGSGANSAFHRQATGFHHGHHQVSAKNAYLRWLFDWRVQEQAGGCMAAFQT